MVLAAVEDISQLHQENIKRAEGPLVLYENKRKKDSRLHFQVGGETHSRLDRTVYFNLVFRFGNIEVEEI